MIADSLTCQDTIIYCTSADDEFKFSIQGAGDIYSFNQRCGDFLSNFNWEAETELLETDVNAFEQKFLNRVEDAGEITYRNSVGDEFTSSDDFKFEYEIGWNIKSLHQECYAGDSFDFPQPRCELECQSQQCLLKPLTDHNRSRRLQLAGSDIVEATYVDAQLPLRIPTEILNLEDSNVPDRLLQIYLNNYNMADTASPGPDRSVLVVEESVEED